MNASDIRAVIDGATGAPVSGPVADAIPAIVEALDAALNPKVTGAKAKRIIGVDETR